MILPYTTQRALALLGFFLAAARPNNRYMKVTH